MLKGFKDFLFRGNVVDLAVAVVIGAAFVAIVKAFTDGIINPLLAVFGGTDSTKGLGFHLISDKPATFVAVGDIVSAAINFVLVAAIVYFAIVLPVTTIKKRRVTAGETADLTESEILVQIRDLLAAQQQAGGRPGQ